MMKLLRKHRTWLMMVIAILAIPFCIYFVKTDFASVRPEQDFIRIYNRTVPMAEAKKHARGLDLARALGLTELSQVLTSGARDQDEAYKSFVLNLLVLRHEAERLAIRPSQSEVVDVVHNLPEFRGPNGFDLKKYDDFVQKAMSPYGMGEADLETLVRDDLSLRKLKQLLATGLPSPESRIEKDFDQAYSKSHVKVVRLKGADLVRDIKISDEDIQKHFEAHKAEYKTDEKRKVDFIQLTLTDEQKKLTGKERIEALQEVADRANEVSQAVLEKETDFKTAAEKLGLPIHATVEFNIAAPDPQLKAAPQATAAAFKLTEQEPISDPIQTPDGFYILRLTGVTPSRDLTLEEAKPKIVEALKKARSQEMITNKGGEIAHQLREAVKSGESIEAAAKKAGVKVEPVPAFTLMDQPNVVAMPVQPLEPKVVTVADAAENLAKETAAEESKAETTKEAKVADRKRRGKGKKSKVAEAKETPKEEEPKPEQAKTEEPKAAEQATDLIAIQNAVVRLDPGQLSEFSPWDDGGVIVYLEKREPPDGATVTREKSTFEERYLNNQHDVVFFEWLRDRLREQNLLASEPAASPPPPPPPQQG